MNFGVIVEALEFAVNHRKEIASDAEAAIHFVRRVEHLVVKHGTTCDKVLVEADKALSKLVQSEK